MSSPGTLSGTLTAAERSFYAEAMSAVSKVGGHMVASARHHTDGTAEVLTRHGGTWVTLDTGNLRTALTALGQVRPGLTLACDHGYRVDNLITALAHNREAEYDECLIDGLLQIAILGTVAYDLPAGDEQEHGEQQTGSAVPHRDSDLDGDQITRHSGSPLTRPDPLRVRTSMTKAVAAPQQ